jgi:hypothetical protein
MDLQNVNDLHGNPGNPRIIKDTQYESLKKSLDKFGDISGITYNVRLQRLVTGHQRINLTRKEGWQNNIVYLEKFSEPSKKGTVATGYILIGGERYNYREVDWPAALDASANIAANQISAEWDKDALAEMTYLIYQEDPSLLEFTGKNQKEIDQLLAATGMDIPGLEPKPAEELDDNKEDLSFRLTKEQKTMILDVIENVRITKDIPAEDPASMNGSALYYIARDYMTRNPITEIAAEDFLPPVIPNL